MRDAYKVYSVFSRVTKKYSFPMVFKSHEEAAYSFIKFMRSVPYEDKVLYRLYCIGNYDEDYGQMVAWDDPVLIQHEQFVKNFYEGDGDVDHADLFDDEETVENV